MLIQKMRKKSELYKVTEGTYCVMKNENDKANQSRAEEVDIKQMITKYGILPFELMNKAKEPIYLDMRGDDLTINERIKQQQEINEYFKNLPADVRKNYKDNESLFYHNLMNGNYQQLINDGILTIEQANNYTQIKNEKQNQILALQQQIREKEGLINELQTNINTMEKNQSISNI